MIIAPYPDSEPGTPEQRVLLAINNGTLEDLVELTLRIEGITLQESEKPDPELLIADRDGFNASSESRDTPVPIERILLLVADEVEIPEGTEYLVVPKTGDDFDLDPDLLLKKVRDMLEGRRPSADRNPVTRLPGGAAFEADLRERISTGERFGIIFADLNYFKSFNNAYSYARGDKILLSLGELLENALAKHPHPQNFLAHLGSDDFAVITSEKLAPSLAEEIVDGFDEMVAEFYDVVDLARGYVVITDTRGNETEFPIVTIVLAVILSSRRGISHAAEALDVAEEMFRILKSRDVRESCCIVERMSAR